MISFDNENGVNQQVLSGMNNQQNLLNNSGHSSRHHENKLTTIETFNTLIKSGIGTGLLLSPHIINQCGALTSLLIFAITPIFIYYGYMLLVYVLDVHANYRITLQQAVNDFFPTKDNVQNLRKNKIIQLICRICMFMISIGVNISYFILIMNSVGLFLKKNDSHVGLNEEYKPYDYQWQPSFDQKWFIGLLIIMPLYLPLTLYPKIADLQAFNWLGIFICYTTLLTILANCFYIIFFTDGQQLIHSSSPKINEENLEKPNLALAIFLNIGIVVYQFDLNGVISEIRGQMIYPQQFSKTLKGFMVFVAVIGYSIGILGYSAYKDTVQPNIFINLHDYGLIRGKGEILAAYYSLSLIITTVFYTYPIVQYLDNKYIYSKFQQAAPLLEGSEDYDESFDYQELEKDFDYYTKTRIKIKQIILRMVIFLIELFVAIIYPRIENVLNILGCIFSVSLGFIVPYLLYVECFKNYKEEEKPLKMKWAKAIVSIGVFGGVLGLLATIFPI